MARQMENFGGICLELPYFGLGEGGGGEEEELGRRIEE